jgi:hypothetical protein
MSDLTWGLLVGFLVGFGVGVAGTRLLRGSTPSGKRAGWGQAPASSPGPEQTPLLEQILGKGDEAEELRQNLRVKLLYDEAKVDQAVSYERERNPQASEKELLQAAIYRWERENR